MSKSSDDGEFEGREPPIDARIDWARLVAGERGDREALRLDGRRLGRPPPEGMIEATPTLVAIHPEAREEGREILWSRVEEGAMRMDAHERAMLQLALEGDREGVELPDERPAMECYCVMMPLGAEPLEEPLTPVGEGLPVLVPADPREAMGEPIDLDPHRGRRETRRDRRPEPGEVRTIQAVIDDGVGFLNGRFRQGPDRTRFDAVWFQSYEPPRLRLFGRPRASGLVVERGDVDALLASGGLDEEAVYRAVARGLYGEPGRHRALEHAYSHGTHCLDLAGGADPGRPGSERPLLAVCLAPETIDDTAGTRLQFDAIRALRWILWRARSMGPGPVVVTISLGDLAGPKDGTGLLEWAVPLEVAWFELLEGRRVTVNWSFGNARLTRQVARFEDPGEEVAIDWRLQPDDKAASFLEIRSDEGDVDGLEIRVTPPMGSPVRLVPGDPALVINGRRAMRLYRSADPFRGLGPPLPRARPALVLAAGPTEAPDPASAKAPHGRYEVRIRGAGSPLRVEVERGDTPVGRRSRGRQSYLVPPEGGPDGHAFDPESAGWTDPRDTAITRRGTHSSAPPPDEGRDRIGPMLREEADPERVWATGAARPRPEGDPPRPEGPPPRPARYASMGAPWTRDGPTLSAVAERGPATPGVLGAGTLSGSARPSGGSSAAAPRVSRRHGEALEQGRGRPEDIVPTFSAQSPPDADERAALGIGTLGLD